MAKTFPILKRNRNPGTESIEGPKQSNPKQIQHKRMWNSLLSKTYHDKNGKLKDKYILLNVSRENKVSYTRECPKAISHFFCRNFAGQKRVA